MRLAVCEALGVDAAWALASFEKSPYKFNLLQSLAVKMGDLDSDIASWGSHRSPCSRAGVRRLA